MTILSDDIIKLLLAVLAGGLVGLEREYRDKAAGFRTLIFICAGACLFTILSVKFAPNNDPNRIAANIVTGVGFLGAGVILRDGGKVTGLTTAATIWLTAAIGMGIGGREYLISGLMVVIAMVVLWLLPAVEHRIDNTREERRYEVRCEADFAKIEALENAFQAAGLRIQAHSQVKTGGEVTCAWRVSGSPESHRKLVKLLFDNPDIRELKC
ncbi:MAG: MgtC/SapB family protein [Anaerolineaceae bacterium]